MSPFFSIIIPVYNVAPYLRECLDSVLAQTFTDWEAICVDDGSTDGSGAILDEYAAKDKRFIVIHKKNEGVSVARNTALEAVNGRYIVFIDADDVVLRDWLKVFNEVIAKDRCDVVRGSLRYWYGEQDYKHASGPKYSIVARYVNKEEVCAWGVAEVLESGYSCLNCVKRELIVGVKFPVGTRLMEDIIFCLNIMTRIRSVSIIDYNGYLYRLRESSAVHTIGTSYSIIAELCNLFQAIIDFWRGDVLTRASQLDIELLRREITLFVFKHTMMLGIANRRRYSGDALVWKDLAHALRNMYVQDVLDVRALSGIERVLLLLYIKASQWRGLLLLWKVRAFRHKLFERLAKIGFKVRKST